MGAPLNPPEIRKQIGIEILHERANRVPWKMLARKYGYRLARLKMLAKEAEKAIADSELEMRG